MFFWFANETFSIIDALIKLILVITGSALIICFCHKLTNYKKSRRYKTPDRSHFSSNQQPDIAAARHFSVLNGTTALTNHHHLLAYDPYNSIRSTYNCQLAANCAQDQIAFQLPHLTSAYGYQSAAIESLSRQPQEADNATGGSLIAAPTNLIANPIYSTANLASSADGSSFRARLVEQSGQADDFCPTYEEAIAAAERSCQTAPLDEPAAPAIGEANEQPLGQVDEQAAAGSSPLPSTGHSSPA